MPLPRLRQCAKVAALLLIGCLWLPAQSQNPPAQQQQNPPPSSDQDDLQTFKAEVNVVNLFYNVKDKHGMLIPGLTKDDFEVFEDGKPQTIKYFSAESNQPFSASAKHNPGGSYDRSQRGWCIPFL